MDLSIIILSYNTKDITDKCLSCLKGSVDFCQSQLKNSIEAIVVDNASTDGSVEMLKKNHKWVKLIESKVNTGFSGGNNLGMKKSTGSIILLLNSDVFVQKETLLKSLQFFQNHSDCDGLGPRLHFADGSLQPSAGYLPTPINTILWISGLSLIPPFSRVSPIHPKDPDFYKKERAVEWVMGAFFMLKREIYEKTSGFDETIFMYGEEVEWCKRIKDSGFKIWYVSSIVVTHLDKASSNFNLEKPLLNEIKGIVRFFHQHYPVSWPFVKIVMYKFLILRILAFFVLGKMPRARAYWQALKIL